VATARHSGFFFARKAAIDQYQHGKSASSGGRTHNGKSGFGDALDCVLAL
jgi:hypothetical protein